MSRRKLKSNTFLTSRNRYLLQTYGITQTDYERLLQEQGFSCFICRRPATTFKRRLAVDHSHTTLKVRGLLCPFCNRGLRYYQDRADWLRRAAEHVERDTGFRAPGNRKRRRKRSGRMSCKKRK